MKDPIYLLAFGTFGNPNGFRQSPFIAEDPQFFKSIKTFDLNTNSIKLFPGNTLYAIRKEIVNGLKTVAYTIYTYAKEQNSDRGGTFIGSSLIFIGEIADENITISKLNEFHKTLVLKNTTDEVISVNHSDQFSAELPKDFDKLSFNSKSFNDITDFKSSNKYLVVFCETTPNTLNNYFREALKLLNKYDCIYFTNSEEIAKFVNDKGIYKLIQNVGHHLEYENEVNDFKLEQEEKINFQILEFEKEKENLGLERDKRLSELETQLVKNLKFHKENDDKINALKKNISDGNKNYAEFSKIIAEVILLLKSHQNIDHVKQFFVENKRQFLDSLKNGKEVVNFKLTSFPELKFKPDFENSNFSHQNWDNNNSKLKSNNNRSDKPKYDIFKILTFCSLLLWSGSIIYFFIIDQKKESAPISVQNISDSIKQKLDRENFKYNLKPFPNDSLSKGSNKILANKLKENLNLNKVVEIVFNANPESVKKYYQFQKEDYKKILFQKNPKAFTIIQNDTIFTGKDSLRVIPSRKLETATVK